MKKVVFITTLLTCSTGAMAETFNPTPNIDRLEAKTDLELRLAPYTQPTTTTLFEWKLDEPFWIALGSIVLSTSIVLLAIHASKNGHPVSLVESGSSVGGPPGA